MTYPLSQSQIGIYVTCINSHDEGQYNFDMLYTLDDDTDLDRLAKALDNVIEAHPYVKARITTDENGEVCLKTTLLTLSTLLLSTQRVLMTTRTI